MWQAKTETLQRAWTAVDPEIRDLLTPIQTQSQYQEALAAFEILLAGMDNSPSEATTQLFHLLGEHLHTYEQRDALPGVSGREMLQFLMEQHQLKQADLPEIGSQGVVSEILSGKRALTVRQAKAIGTRFGLDFRALLD